MSKTAMGLAAATMLAVGLFEDMSSAQQTVSNYRFEILDMEVQASWDAEVRVRLVHIPDSRPVFGAVLFEQRFEMLVSGYKVPQSSSYVSTSS